MVPGKVVIVIFIKASAGLRGFNCGRIADSDRIDTDRKGD